MTCPVFATFSSETEAEQALSAIASQVKLLDSAVVAEGVEGTLTLDSLELAPEERTACMAQLQRGGFLLIAQAPDDGAKQNVLRILHSMTSENAPLVIAEAGASSTDHQQERGSAERIPLVEEELRIGRREVVRGRKRVTSKILEVPVSQEVELLEETVSTETRPVNRLLTQEEVAQAGLLQDRVFEIALMRQEAVVTKQPFVREELIVTKHVEQKVQQVHETLRRTEVETERLPAEETRQTEKE